VARRERARTCARWGPEHGLDIDPMQQLPRRSAADAERADEHFAGLVIDAPRALEANPEHWDAA
jgi:hypothetical protein